ncbi:RNA pseudouridine synthase [Lactobacillus xylocopicola]|uniref:RNA pseudouridylate synthase n=1 Tax=Lactobacillus xylocopicola TaxID=2976676 RepID=A0ABM8BHL0_9LACO|nr:RNA pseudouridine synthase [Lactobacillus xylocopicola]
MPRKWRHYLRIEQNVLVNGHYRHFSDLVYPNDQVELLLNRVEPNQQPYPASTQIPDIIYEDDNLLVINKPAGQKTHPNLAETNTALNDCATYLGTTPFIVHRLDMLTSGLLLVAKNPAVVPSLNRQLTTKTFHREYLALVTASNVLKDSGIINLPIGKDPDDQRKRMVVPSGLNSLTNYQVLERRANQTALVKLSLETGRTHQIRVHLAALGCPIIGDPLYNPEALPGQLLHLTAYQMSFTQPFSFERKQLKLPLTKVGFIK